MQPLKPSMRRLAIALAACLPLLAAAPARADQSPNVEVVSQVGGLASTAIAVNFVGDTMVVSTITGIVTYDVSNPAEPVQLGVFPMYIWENEDMDVDVKRKLAFVSRDPRGFTSPVTPGALFPYGAVHVLDVSNPHAIEQVGFFLVPAGHTTTCVNDCDAIWTSGPYASTLTQEQQNGWVGRPIFATDVRDPSNPVPCPEPLDLGRNDGVTDYVHDVQVDAQGVAWVSGAGGVRGYWTRGTHRNPLTGKTEEATACKPIPAGGGGTPDSATPSRFMHNSWRNVDASAETRTKRLRKKTRGMVLYGTEENVVSECATSGRFAIYDLRGTLKGEGFKDIDKTKQRMKVLDTWTPEGQPGATGCASAHYFADRGDGLLAYAFYGQGVRFLDVTNPRDIRQVGYYRPDTASTWAAYWRKGLVYVADNGGGVTVLRLKGGTAGPTRRAPAVAPRRRLQMDPLLGGLCPVTPDRVAAPAGRVLGA